MIKHLACNPRRRVALLRFLLAATLLLTGAIMAAYAAAPQSEEGSPQNDASAAAPQKIKGAATNNIYIVQMAGEPVATYRGGVAGLRATAPAPGRKIDQRSADVMRYTEHLRAQHDAVLSQIGGEKVYSYLYVLNGFSAKLTEKQVAALRKHPDVVAIEKDEALHLDTSTTHRFLGLSRPGGLWEQLGGGNNQTNGPGENMVVAIIDSGIVPEHPSFKATNDQGASIYPPITDHTGTCQATSTDNSWNASFCNGKIVSARKYNAGHGGDSEITRKYPWEFLSPRDFDGHGSHVGSTAAGNFGVTPDNHLAALGPMSGMAPRARIAVYKVCWETMDPTSGGCFSNDSLAAMDQATADGVDAMNFSISGNATNFNQMTEVGMRNAAAAGVFVATSAGNDGPGASTVAKPGPWNVNVANGSHDRAQEATLTLGDGQTFNGVSTNTTGAGPAPLIRAQDAGAATAPSANSVALCFSKTWNGNNIASLDPAKVNGKIVVCERGTNDRVDKSKAVAEAGGVGMVLVNTSANTLNADTHSIPTTHHDHVQRVPIQAYAQTAGATARISPSFLSTTPAPFTANGSSRGPSLAAGGDILKPDMIAPGTDILAAVAPPGNGNQSFALYSGTSMASPHVAGIGMLLKQQHPNWSPMMIKSALMTTGTDVLDTGLTVANRIFRQGAGHVAPNNATNPGLVFDSNLADWQAFMCAAGFNPGGGQATCNALAAAGKDTTNPSNLNQASIAIGDLVGSETIKRTVTNVSSSNVTYTASVQNPPGMTITVDPPSMALAPGQSATVNITIARTNAAFGTYAGGHVTWTGGGHTVRIPVVARPVIMSIASTASSAGAPINVPVKFGYQGTFTAVPRGMVAAVQQNGTVSDDPNDNFTPGGPGTVSFDVVVPAGTTYARFALFDENTDKPGQHDLDIIVYRVSTNTQIVATGGSTSNEEANIVNPVADTYRVWVHGFQTADGGTASFTLFSWILGSNAERNMFVLSPWQAANGATGNINVRFANLTPNTKYLGSIVYSGTTGLPAPTIVRVDTPAALRNEAQLVEIASVRSHGALGERELVFPAGSPAVESRRGANGTGDYTVIFRFSAPISQGNASPTSGSGTVSSKAQNGNDLVVNLTGVTNAQTMTFDLTDVVDADGNAVAAEQAQVRFLVGDVNGDMAVNAGDVTRVRSNSGSSADGAAIGSDINCDGFVNSGDVTAVKNASGTSL